MGSNSFGIALVAGSILVPKPATGIIALEIFFMFTLEAEVGIEPA